jgi:4-hydroxy-tetrahydrodipicolinate reductase
MPISRLHSIGVVGASGRLGARIVALARERGVALPVLVSRRAGWTIERRPDVVVDASHRSALPEIIAYCQREAVPLVCATSNLDDADGRALASLAERGPVVRAANLSFGHYLQTEALAAIGRCLARHGHAAEVRIVERHPAHKQDRPSATALRLEELWHRHGGAALVESLRHGPPVGDHQIGWTFEGEELVIDHRVTDRGAAARGALIAAAWITGRPSGLSDMTDVYQ